MAKSSNPSKKPANAAHHFHPGRKLRALRTARKLTMDQLSTMAGVSKAMLSQIEQDKVNPTVAVMLKVCNALKTSIGDLLESAEADSIIRIIPASEKSYTFRSDEHCNIRTLSPLGLEKAIEFYRLVLEPGGELASEPHFLGTEEIIYVSKGQLTVTSGSQQAEVSKGDSIHYHADIPHSLRNTGRGQVEGYMIVRYREE